MEERPSNVSRVYAQRAAVVGIVCAVAAGVLYSQWIDRRSVHDYLSAQDRFVQSEAERISRSLVAVERDARTLGAVVDRLEIARDTAVIGPVLTASLPSVIVGARWAERAHATIGTWDSATSSRELSNMAPTMRFTMLRVHDRTLFEVGPPDLRVRIDQRLLIPVRSDAGQITHPSRISAVVARWGDSVFLVAADVADKSRTISPALLFDSLPDALRSALSGTPKSGIASKGLFDHEPVVISTASLADDGLALVLQRRTADLRTVLGNRAPRWRMTALVALSAGALAALLVMTASTGRLRRAEALLASRASFVSAVSHELRTPLAQIQAFAELLERAAFSDPADRTRALRIIRHEAQRLALLVENVLSMSEPVKAPVRRSPLHSDLTQTMIETLEAFQPILSRRGVSVQLNLPGVDMVAMAQAPLRQILLNVLDNAVKYGPDGQTLRIRSTRDDDCVRLLVDDEGPGISAHLRNRIWEPFERGAHSGDQSIPGSGLGLAVVQQILTSVGGSASVESNESGGTRVILVLPASSDT